MTLHARMQLVTFYVAGEIRGIEAKVQVDVFFIDVFVQSQLVQVSLTSMTNKPSEVNVQVNLFYAIAFRGDDPNSQVFFSNTDRLTTL